MKTNVLLALLLAGSVSTGFANDEADAAAEKSILLKDGATLYVFRDGNMALANKYGRAVSKSEGEVMETKDGAQVAMVGNKFARLERLINRGHRGGGGR